MCVEMNALCNFDKKSVVQNLFGINLSDLYIVSFCIGSEIILHLIFKIVLDWVS